MGEIKSYKDLLIWQKGITIVNLIYQLVRSFPQEELSASAQWQQVVNNVSTINELCYEVVLKMFKQVDKNKTVIYSGGCALNVDWNRRLLDLGYKVDIQPHVYDGGLSIGCLRYGLHILGIEMQIPENFPYVQDDTAPEQRPSTNVINKVADLLAQGKIVAWYQGNGELGPRALGNRSILMNPTIKNGKDILNAKVKRREWFRPFGASIKEDKCLEHFDLNYNPYMLFTSNVLNKDLHAVTHVDGTCRHQTVNSDQNEDFYSLLDSFETKTGLPVLLNTSLNLGGKPIASNPQEAIELLNTTELDAVCIGNEVIIK
jgi:carbamoyltransferase